MEINISIERGLGKLVKRTWLKRVVEKVLVAENVNPDTELSLAIVGQERIRQLNLNYRGYDEPTDVLSFSMLPEQNKSGFADFVKSPDGVRHLGEVIIAYPQAAIQAGEHHHTIDREITLLIIHGVLHLIGYDHEQPEMELEMRAREASSLNEITGELG